MSYAPQQIQAKPAGRPAGWLADLSVGLWTVKCASAYELFRAIVLPIGRGFERRERGKSTDALTRATS